MTSGGSGDITLSTLWIPVAPSTEGIDEKFREIGERARREFSEGFGGGHDDFFAGLTQNLPSSMQTISMGTASMIGAISGAVSAGVQLVVRGAEEMASAAIRATETVIGTVKDLGESYEKLNDQIVMMSTNSALLGDAKNVLGDLDAPADKLGTDLAMINTRLGLTGDALDKVTKHAEQMRRMFGGSFDVDAVTQGMKEYGVAAGDVDNTLGLLIETQQRFSVSANTIVQQIAKNGDALKEMGLSYQQSVFMLGELNSMNSQAGSGIDRFVQQAQKGAEKAHESLQQYISDELAIIRHYQEIGDTADANSEATLAFGRKAKDALDIGKAYFDTLAQSPDVLKGHSESVDKAAEATHHLNEAMDSLKNKVLGLFGDAAAGALDFVTKGLDSVGKWFSDHHEAIAATVKDWGDKFVENLPAIKHFVAEAIIVTGQFIDFTVHGLGLITEAIGELFGNKTLEDFGRTLTNFHFEGLTDSLGKAIENARLPDKLQEELDKKFPKIALGVDDQKVHDAAMKAGAGFIDGFSQAAQDHMPGWLKWIFDHASWFGGIENAFAPDTPENREKYEGKPNQPNTSPWSGGAWVDQTPPKPNTPTPSNAPPPDTGTLGPTGGFNLPTQAHTTGFTASAIPVPVQNAPSNDDLPYTGMPPTTDHSPRARARRRAAMRVGEAEDTLADANDNLAEARTNAANADKKMADLNAKHITSGEVYDEAVKESTKAHRELHRAIRRQIEAQDRLSEAQEEPIKGGEKGGGPAYDFGSQFLGGLLSDLGIGNVLGGKSPLQWGATRMGLGALNYGLGLLNSLGIGPASMLGGGAASAPIVTGPQEVSPFGAARGPSPGPGGAGIPATVGPQIQHGWFGPQIPMGTRLAAVTNAPQHAVLADYHAPSSGIAWDKIAAKESGGNWSIPSDSQGRPYRGGLQILDSTWKMYGGEQFAPTANLATKDQQITVAERIYGGWNGIPGQGAQAWPNTFSAGAPSAQTSAAMFPQGANVTYTPAVMQSLNIPPLFTNPPGGGAPTIPGWVQDYVHEHGGPDLTASSTPHGSLHGVPGGSGWAVDVTGNPAQQDVLAQYAVANPGMFAQVIHQGVHGEPYGVAGGQVVSGRYYTTPGGTYGDEAGMVHMAFAGQPGGVGYAMPGTGAQPTTPSNQPNVKPTMQQQIGQAAIGALGSALGSLLNGAIQDFNPKSWAGQLSTPQPVHYDQSIHLNASVADSSGLQRAMKEEQMARYYGLSGGLPLPSVGAP